MSFGHVRVSASLEDILNKTTEIDILSFYLGILRIPCIIHSPLREDKKPSFGLYSLDGKKVYYTDFSTREKGSTFDLLSHMWNKSYKEVLEKIYEDIPKFKSNLSIKKYTPCTIECTKEHNSNSDLKCKIREWKDYDIEYWESYGISLKWLKYAEVYPISHKIIIKDNKKYVFNADKYAYVYVEHKENKVTLKIYQPYNQLGYKWSNKHDSSVISLWTKVPKQGDFVCICSSLKDALCLWANTGIPSLAIQGEGYRISNTAVKELKKRFKKIYILLDNDEPGLKLSKKLAEETGFINVILPEFKEGKDISDLYFTLQDKKEFKKIIINLFN